jgi:site-specific recombinase XerD
MHPLREAMLDQMRLRGHSPRTQQSYLHAVSLLSRHYHRSPDRLSQEDLQNWILYLVKDRKLAAASCRLYLNAIRFFYLQVLRWPECRLELITPKRPQRIPYLLSPSEVRRIIDHADNPKYAMMLALCYACGLRVSELVALQVSHIHGEAGYCQVVQGKGQKDRQVPLPATVLQMLRGYWQAFQPASWLFTGRDREQPLSSDSVQKYYRKTRRQAGIPGSGGIHGLRHAFATHQLAAGMSIQQLKDILGHRHLSTTARYLHWYPPKPLLKFDLLAECLEETCHD